MRIVVTPLTSGPVTPGLQAISGGYRYQRDPTWTPNDPRYRDGGEKDPGPRQKNAMEKGRAERIRRYKELRDEGVSQKDAAAELGVCWSTARDYEAALPKQEAQPG